MGKCCKCSQGQDHYYPTKKCSCNNCRKQTWPLVGRDLTARSYNPGSKISKANLAALEEAYRTNITNGPDSVTSNYAGVSVDEKRLYLTQFMNQSETEVPTNPDLERSSRLIAIDRETGVVVWSRRIKDYTGKPTSQSRSTPAIYKDSLFIADTIFSPQTWLAPDAPPGSPDIAFDALSGQPEAPPSGGPPVLISINKHTGDLQWTTPLAPVAENIYSHGNFRIITQSPIVFEADVTGEGERRPVVAIGTSTVQSGSFTSIILPTEIQTPVGPIPFPFPGVPATLSYYGFEAAPTLPVLGRKAQALGADPTLNRRTDQGEIFLIDALSGIKLASVMTSPTAYKAGDTLGPDAIRSQDGLDHMLVWKFPTQDDVAPDGPLLNLTKNYAGRQHLTYTLETKPLVEVQKQLQIPVPQRNKIPKALDGLTIWGIDRVNETYAPVKFENVKAGDDIPDDLEGAVASVEAEFFVDTDGVSKARIFPDAASTDCFVCPIADLNLAGTSPVPFGSDYGLRQTRILKRLFVGDVLDGADAYEASHFGASSWGNSCTVRTDEYGTGLELYAPTGQNHHIPADDLEAIFGIFHKTRVERVNEIKNAKEEVLNVEYIPKIGAEAAVFVGQLFNIETKKNEGDPVTKEDASFFRDWEEHTVDQDRGSLEVALKHLSARGRRNSADSFLCINLQPGHFGKLEWAFKTKAYDEWVGEQTLYGLNLLSVVQVFPIFPALINIAPAFYDVNAYYGISRAADGDVGQGPYIFPKGSVDKDNDAIVLATKAGLMFTVVLDPTQTPAGAAPYVQYINPENGVVLPKVTGTVRSGPSSIAGSSNFGSAGTDAGNLYANQQNILLGRLPAVVQGGPLQGQILHQSNWRTPTASAPVVKSKPIPGVTVDSKTNYATSPPGGLAPPCPQDQPCFAGNERPLVWNSGPLQGGFYSASYDLDTQPPGDIPIFWYNNSHLAQYDAKTGKIANETYLNPQLVPPQPDWSSDPFVFFLQYQFYTLAVLGSNNNTSECITSANDELVFLVDHLGTLKVYDGETLELLSDSNQLGNEGRHGRPVLVDDYLFDIPARAGGISTITGQRGGKYLYALKTDKHCSKHRNNNGVKAVATSAVASAQTRDASIPSDGASLVEALPNNDQLKSLLSKLKNVDLDKVTATAESLKDVLPKAE